MKMLIETDELCVECADAIIDAISGPFSAQPLRIKEQAQSAAYRERNLEKCRANDRAKTKRYYYRNRLAILRKRQERREQQLYGSGF